MDRTFTRPHAILALAAALLVGHAPAFGEAAATPETGRAVTLQSLLTDASDRSPKVQAARRAYEAARGRVLAAWLPEDPMVGVDVEGQSRALKLDRTNNEYMVSQTMPFPTTLLLRGLAASKEAQMAYERYREVERDALWHIEQPYHEFFLATQTARALEETRQLVDRLAQAVQARYESNQASQQDLLKARIEAAKLGIEAYEWDEQARLAQAHISHILDEPLSTVWVLAEPERTPFPEWDADDFERLALKSRPELKALQLAITQTKLNRWIETTSWLPTITGRIEARQFAGEGSVREYDTFLGLSVPVWSLLKGAGGGWKAAGKDVDAAEATYGEMKNEVLLAIREGYSKLSVAHRAVTTYEQTILPQARQQTQVAFAAYEGGRSDLLSLIDAQRMQRDALIAYYRYLAQYEVALADLRLAVGGPWEDPS